MTKQGKQRKAKRPDGITVRGSQREMCSLGETGEPSDWNWDPENASPQEVATGLKLARVHLIKNAFLAGILPRKVSFYNFGFKLKPVGKLSAEIQKSHDEWWRNVGGEIGAFARDTWVDWLLMCNVVGFWRIAGNRTRGALLLPPEDCYYTDALGYERMKVRFRFKANQLVGSGMTEAEIRRYISGYIVLDEEKGEFFKVLRRGRKGQGFTPPSLIACYRSINQMQSMEVGDNLISEELRRVVMQIKIGHEIRNGPRAGTNHWFWTQRRSDAMQKQFEGRKGRMDITTNFDVDFVYPGPDTKRLGHDKYDSVIQRLALWSGPVGMMYVAKQANESLLQMLKADVAEDRRQVGDWLTSVINQAWDPPAKVQVKWSNAIFTDPAQASNLLRFGLQTGPLSQKTFIEQAGWDVDEERANKQEEALLPAAQKLPVFDSAHGTRPGAGQGGRPKGSPGDGPEGGAATKAEG